ncbi:MAG: Spy/CpxP family protein refolding chaperone [Elusimicrobiota bacterium]
MKRILCAVISAGLLATVGLTARAFAEDEGGKDAGRGGEHSDKMKKGERGEHAERMLTERLGLSDDQAAKLKAAFEGQKKAEQGLREQSKQAERKLEEEVRGLASDKDIQATLDQLDANRKAMAEEHQKFESSVASILKPYQRAKMRLMMAEHMKKGGWGHEDGDMHDRKDRDRDGDRDHERGEDRHNDDD